MLIANRHAIRGSYPTDLQALINRERAHESRRWLSGWPVIASGPTPLHDLPDLAARLRVSRVLVKDESVRSPLGSFKALGAPVALVREVARLHRDVDPGRVLTGRYADRLRDYTVISATDGNHGRALAAAARDVGCRCVIVLHARVSAEREEAIAAQGAHVVRVAGNYDASVQEATRLAASNGWQVLSDTSYEGYEQIPCDVMQGYGLMAAEVLDQLAETSSGREALTHVFLQGGVGGLPAGIASYFWEELGERRPTFIVVEPRQADCLMQSAVQGRPAKASGTVDSVMAGLACGDASPLAWRFLERCVDFFTTIDDEQAVAAMRLLARGGAADVPIVAGESGAAGVAGLVALREHDARSSAAGLDARSVVLVINTEGATAPAVYEQLVGERAESVSARQAAWQPTPAL